MIVIIIFLYFQGLCVATLFCFFNGEVLAQIKRKWRTIFYSNRPRSNSYTATQVSVSASLRDYFGYRIEHIQYLKLDYNHDALLLHNLI